MAAALAAKNTDTQHPHSTNGVTNPVVDREPKQSPERAHPSCVSAPSIPMVQEVRLQPGQQSIVLVCPCGARTSIQITHTMAEPTPVAVPFNPVDSKSNDPNSHQDPDSTEPEYDPVQASARSGLMKPKKGDSSHLDDGLPSPVPFTVYELYAYRGTSYNEPVFIDDALLRTGELRFGYHVTVTTDPDRGFKLCAPTWLHRLSWGSMYRNHGCQIPGKLIVCAYGFLTPRDAMWSYVDVYRLIQLLGRNWKERFHK